MSSLKPRPEPDQAAMAAAAAESIVRMRAGAMLAADDALWARFAEAAERMGVDSEHTAPGRMLASAPSWIAARRALLQAKSRGPGLPSLMQRLALARDEAGGPGAKPRREQHLVGFERVVSAAAAQAVSETERLAAQCEASGTPSTTASGASRPRGGGGGGGGGGRVTAKALRQRRQAATARAALRAAASAPAAYLIRALPASPWPAPDETPVPPTDSPPTSSPPADSAAAAATPAASLSAPPPAALYAAARRALLARRFARLLRWSEDTALQRMAAAAMQRALQAEREEVGKWVQSDAEDSSEEEEEEEEEEEDDVGAGAGRAALRVGRLADEEDAPGELPGGFAAPRGRAGGRSRSGSVLSTGTASASVAGSSRGRLRGKALRLGVAAELREWMAVSRLGSGGRVGGRDGRAGSDDDDDDDVEPAASKPVSRAAGEAMRLPPPPSAMPLSSLAEGRGRAGSTAPGGSGNSAGGAGGGGSGTAGFFGSGGAGSGAGRGPASGAPPQAVSAPLPAPLPRAVTALVFAPGTSTPPLAFLPPQARAAAVAAGSGHGGSAAAVPAPAGSALGGGWAPPRGPSGGDVFASARQSAAGAVIEVSDAPSGKTFAVLTGHTAAVTALAWDPTGSYLLSAGLDGQVRLWAVSSPRYVAPDAQAIRTAVTALAGARAAAAAAAAAGGGAEASDSASKAMLAARAALRPTLRGGSARCVRLLVRDTPVTHASFLPTSSNLFLVARAQPRPAEGLLRAAARAMAAPSAAGSGSAGGSGKRKPSPWSGLIEVINASTGHSAQHVLADDVITGLCFARTGGALFWADVRGRIHCADVALGSSGRAGGLAGSSAGGGGAGGRVSAASLAMGTATSAGAGGPSIVDGSARVIFDQGSSARAMSRALRGKVRGAGAGEGGDVAGGAGAGAGHWATAAGAGPRMGSVGSGSVGRRSRGGSAAGAGQLRLPGAGGRRGSVASRSDHPAAGQWGAASSAVGGRGLFVTPPGSAAGGAPRGAGGWRPSREAVAGLAFDNDGGASAAGGVFGSGASLGSGGDDGATVASWAGSGRGFASSPFGGSNGGPASGGGPGAGGGSGTAGRLGGGYVVRLEHRPYDTLLRAPALVGLDAWGNRRTFALCVAGGAGAVLERAAGSSLAVLGLGGSALREAGAVSAAALLHPWVLWRGVGEAGPQGTGSASVAEGMSSAGRGDRAVGVGQLGDAAAGTPPPAAVLKPWQVGRRRHSELRAAEAGRAAASPGSPASAAAAAAVAASRGSSGGFAGLFSRRGGQSSTGSAVSAAGGRGGRGIGGFGGGSGSGVSGSVEVVATRSRRAVDVLATAPISSAATCGAGSDCLAVGCCDGDVAVIDPYAKSAAGTVVTRLRSHVRGVTAVAWSGDDARLATADEGGVLLLWEHPISLAPA